MSCTTPPASRNGETLHYIHTDAPYTFTGNEEISTIGGEVHGTTTYKNLINLSPGSREKSTKWDGRNWTKRHEEKMFRPIGQDRFLVSTPAQDGIPRDNESINPVAGLRSSW